jgi:hypothetical protein
MACDIFEEGAHHCLKSIPMLVLMASFLDPRMKAGIGIPALDKGYMWRMIPEAQQRPQQEQHAGAQEEPQKHQQNLNQPI